VEKKNLRKPTLPSYIHTSSKGQQKKKNLLEQHDVLTYIQGFLFSNLKTFEDDQRNTAKINIS
jgi:hypothetical protein